MYELSSKMSTEAPIKRKSMFESVRLNISCCCGVRSPCGMLL